jgi:hypothetical protein
MKKTVKAWALLDGEGINKLEMYEPAYEIYDSLDIATENAGRCWSVVPCTITYEVAE